MTAASHSIAEPRDALRTSWWGRQRARWRVSFGHTATTDSEVELVQRRIYLLPSARGIAVIVIAVLLLLVGVNYQLSLAYVVAFLLAGLMQTALLASYRNLRGLIVRAGRSPSCLTGENLAFRVGLSSPDRSRKGVVLTSQSGKQVVSTGRLSLAADASIGATLTFRAKTRGVLPLQRIVVESRAPYGLVRAWSYVHFQWAGLVEPVPESPSPSLPISAGDATGAAPNAHVAHDPDSLREYVPGDSLRRVAWKQVAKSGDWYTRTGDAGAKQEIDLTWQAISLTDTEQRLSRMAAWLARAHNENCAYSLILPNGQLPLADGSQQYADALQLLAVYPQRIEDVQGLR